MSPDLKMRFASRCVILAAILLTAGFFPRLQAYAPLGHEIVGAIADERLANTPTAAKISVLIDGMTLEKAAVIADEIKGWDKKGVDVPRAFHYSAHSKIDRQLRDFWRANQPTHDINSAVPSHHWFHYTDVPVVRVEKYAEGRAGRSKWDVVHMIPYCIAVLRGRVPEQNERKITKLVAIILLAHFVADIHQPLHVGAEYFDAQGHVDDPDKDKSALGDEGGNTFTLQLSDEPPRAWCTRKSSTGWGQRCKLQFPGANGRAAVRTPALIDPAKTAGSVRWRCANQKTGGCRQTSMSHITLKPGRMKSCQLRARHMSGCNLGMHTPNRKRIAWSPLVKPRKNFSRTTFLTAYGQPMSCAKNCTKPAGVSPISWRKLLHRQVPTFHLHQSRPSRLRQNQLLISRSCPRRPSD